MEASREVTYSRIATSSAAVQLAVDHEKRADDDHDDVHHAVKQTGYGMEPGHGVVHGLS